MFLRQTVGASAWMLGCKPSEVDDEQPASAPTAIESSPPPLEPPPLEPPAAITPGLDGEFPDWTLGGESSSSTQVLMFRGSPRHDFYGTGPLAERPELIWRTRLGEARGHRADGSLYHWQGTGWTGQAVCWGQRVFVGALDGKLHCFNARSGQTMWAYQGGGMFKGSPCFYAGRLYVGNVDNRIRCIDARNGALLWNYYNPRDCDSSPCVVGGKLYIGGEDGRLKCFDPETGDLHWQLALGEGKSAPPGSGGIESSPAVADGEVYVGHYDGYLLCADAQTGTQKWRARTGADTDSSPVIVGDRVYIAAQTESPYLRCFDRSDKGALVWEFANTRGYWATPAVLDNRVYIGGHDNVMYCLDASTGAVIWTYKAGGPIWSSACVVDGKVLFGSHDPWFYMLDARTGQLIWRYEMGARTLSTACVVGGRIYLGSGNGWFHCFG
jgi:eukaryotic-like serine/threonine-protein kinase